MHSAASLHLSRFAVNGVVLIAVAGMSVIMLTHIYVLLVVALPCQVYFIAFAFATQLLLCSECGCFGNIAYT